MKKKTKVVALRLTSAEYKRWRQFASAEKIALSVLIRNAVIRRMEESPPVEFVKDTAYRVVQRKPTATEQRRRRRLELEWEATGIEEALADEALQALDSGAVQ